MTNTPSRMRFELLIKSRHIGCSVDRYITKDYHNGRYKAIDVDLAWIAWNEQEKHISELEQRLAAAEDRLESAEALMNRMAMNMMLSDHKAESNNNPIKEWLDLVIKWKKAARPEVKGE